MNNLSFATEVEIGKCHRVRSRNQSGKHKTLNNAKKLRDTGMHLHLRIFFKQCHGFTKNLWEEVLQYQRQSKLACLSYQSIIVREFGSVR